MKKREFFLISYLPTLENVNDVLNKKLKQIDRYAYIMHDKDFYTGDVINADTGLVEHKKGEIKPPHIHIYLKTLTDRETNEIRRWFTSKDSDGQTINCLAQNVFNRVGCINYLTHNTPKANEKYQYSKDDVIAFNIDGIETDDEEPKDNSYYIVEDILKGENPMKMLKKYGRDYIYHYGAFQQFANDVKMINKVTAMELNALSGLKQTLADENGEIIEQTQLIL